MAKYTVPVRESFEWQQAVADKDLSAPPGSPSKGDRYIVATGGSGDGTGHDKDIAEYDGSAWTFVTPTEGFQCWVKDEDEFYVYDGTNWKKLEETSGDMLKSVYDTDDDGIVDKAETVDDGAGNSTTAAQVKEAYDRRASYDADLKCLVFDNL